VLEPVLEYVPEYMPEYMFALVLEPVPIRRHAAAEPLRVRVQWSAVPTDAAGTVNHPVGQIERTLVACK
jgi:hypothetical protein